MVGQDEEIMEALRNSRAIWMRKGQHSREAKKAAQAVGIVLARAGGPRFDMQLMSRSMEDVPMGPTGSHQNADEEEVARVWKDDKWLEAALCLDQGEAGGEFVLQ